MSVIGLGVYFVMLLVLSVPVQVIIGVYVYRDAKRRGMNEILWALAAALVPSFIGLLIYLIVRGNYSDLRCPKCETPVKEQYVICPNCGARLRPACPNCATPVEQDWKLCPKCAQPLTEISMEVHYPTRTKDKSLGKVIAIVIAIPVLLILLLVLGRFVFSFSGAGSTGVRTVTTKDYYTEMEEAEKGEIADKVKKWVEDIDGRERSAYALQYTQNTGNGEEQYFLIYIPSTGKQTHTGIGQHNGLFGTTLSLEASSVSGERAFINLVFSGDEVPKLKINLDGEKLPCEVTRVNYNPTLFYIVPQYDEIEPEAEAYIVGSHGTVFWKSSRNVSGC